MSRQTAIPLIVLAHSEEEVEAVNAALRDAGLPVHCAWFRETSDLGEALEQINPLMAVLFADESVLRLQTVAGLRDHHAPETPIVVVRETLDEDTIAADMAGGAVDTVSLTQRARLQAVCGRELAASRLRRALSDTVHSARQYEGQLRSLMEQSADAIAHIKEGIVVDVNPAWLELFGYEDADALVGLPLMDLFDDETHPVLKGALQACIRGRWDGSALSLTALQNGNSGFAVNLELTLVEFDGEPAVRLSTVREREERNADTIMRDALDQDPVTGLLQRQRFVQHLEQRTAGGPVAGVRCVALVRPDQFGKVVNEIGTLQSERLLGTMAPLLKDALREQDFAGRFGGNVFAVFLERGALRDCEAWAASLVARVTKQIFDLDKRSVSVSCSVGIAEFPHQDAQLGQVLDEAQRAVDQARALGGRRVIVHETDDADTRALRLDQIWVGQIKSALMDNRFRLVQQPIAGLADGDSGQYDILVRMVDEQNDEVLPKVFLPAARRNGLSKNIDRWILGAAAQLAAKTNPGCLFLRLSEASVADESLLPWFLGQIKRRGLRPGQFCLQVTEELVTRHLKPVKAFAERAREAGLRFALEHFGIGRDSLQLLEHVSADYIKIDGSLMEGLPSNEVTQQKVRGLVEAASQYSAATIAERVEDANTMAVLWQLGVTYMQGHYVQEPEVILEAQEAVGV